MYAAWIVVMTRLFALGGRIVQSTALGRTRRYSNSSRARARSLLAESPAVVYRRGYDLLA